MTLVRTTLLQTIPILLVLCVGFPLNAQGQLAPSAGGGGDGGVVILPSSFTLTSGTVDLGIPEQPPADPVEPDPNPDHSDGTDPGNPGNRSDVPPDTLEDANEPAEEEERFRVSVSLSGNDVIRFVIPDQMLAAHAVMITDGTEIRIPVHIVGRQIEIQTQLLSDLRQAHVQRLQILVVSSNGLALNLTIQINEDEIAVTVT